ncbi:DUF3305 domain-containing protein [Alsobacter sp. R-9]
MPQIHVEVGVIIARQEQTGPWGGTVWRVAGVLPAAPPVAPGTPLGRTAVGETFYGGPAGLVFHSGETEHYRDNLLSGAPSVWVALKPTMDGCDVAVATVDPYEAEGLTEGFEDRIDAVPMPEIVREQLEAFVAEHHVERPFYKRKRDKVDPRKGFRRPPQAGARVCDQEES